MYQVLEQTEEEKMAMYLKLPKKKLVEMLINCNNILKKATNVQSSNLNNFSTKFITGCSDCPLCNENDMGAGYNCKLKEYPDNYIKESKKYEAKTPKWCPLKKGAIFFKLH